MAMSLASVGIWMNALPAGGAVVRAPVVASQPKPTTRQPSWVARKPVSVSVKLPARVYSSVASLGAVASLETRNQPEPWMATSYGLPVDWNAPLVMRLSIEPSWTPRPIWADFAPAVPVVAEAPERCSCASESRNDTRLALKPTVLTLARSLAVTSSMIWWFFSPLIAEYMPRIMGGASFRGCSGLLREVRPVGGWIVLRDDCGIDVGEDVIAHGGAIDRRDDGPGLDGDDEGHVVDEDDGLAGALGGGAVDAVLQAGEGLGIEVDPAALDACLGVAAELDGARLLAEDVGERRAARCGRPRRRARARPRRSSRGGRADGRHERGVVRDGRHCTSTMSVGRTPPCPLMVSTGPFAPPKSTFSTTPLPD